MNLKIIGNIVILFDLLQKFHEIHTQGRLAESESICES